MKFSGLHPEDKICFQFRKHDLNVNSRPKKNRKKRSQTTNETHSQTNNHTVHEDDNRSSREKELEEMLSNIKINFSTLNNNDPLKIQLLTIAPND